MLFDLTFPCYLTTFSGKSVLSGKVCAFFLSCLSKFSCINLQIHLAGPTILQRHHERFKVAEEREKFRFRANNGFVSN
jgi:hypothetical protein